MTRPGGIEDAGLASTREQLLTAARGRFDRAAVTGDLAAVDDDDAVAELRELTTRLVDAGDVDIEVMYVLGCLHWLRAVLTSGMSKADELRAAVLLLPLYLRQPGELPEPIRASLASSVVDQGPATYPIALSGLAALLLDEFTHGTGREHGIVALALFRLSLTGLPPDHPARPMTSCNLGHAIMAVDEDPDTAIPLLREAFEHMPADDTYHARCASGLAVALRAKALRDEDPAMLAEAIDHFRIASESSSVAADQLPRVLTDLGGSLLLWLTNAPDPKPDALAEAVAVLARAVELTPTDAPEHQSRHELLRNARTASNAVAIALLDASAGPTTLVEPISLPDPLTFVAKLLGMDATGDGSRHAQSADFSRVVMSYPEHATEDDVLAAAIRTMAKQVEHLPPDERLPTLLARLSSREPQQPMRFWDAESMDEVAGLVDQLDRELPNDHPERDLVRLSMARQRLMRTAQVDGPLTEEKLSQMAAGVQQALAELSTLIPAVAPAEQMPAAATMAHALMSPFRTLALVDDAVRTYRARLSGQPDDVPAMTALAHCLFTRYTVTTADEAYQEAVTLARQVVARTSPPDPGLVSHWDTAATHRSQLAGLTPAGPDTDEPRSGGLQQVTLRNAAQAIAWSDGPGALEALEEGRASTLSMALNTRREVAGLRRLDPGMAEDFVRLRDQVYAGMNFGWEQPVQPARTRDLIQEFDVLCQQIVVLPGFERFLLPLPLGLDDLRPAAAEGPVVIVTVSRMRCDALVLTTDGVRIVPLPNLQAEDVTAQATAFHEAIGILASDGTLTGMANGVVADTLRWLWDAVAEPVLTALEFDVPPDGTRLPRLWWSPIGPLNFLPLHAAGHHDKPGRSVIDRVVSSYTPTLRALLLARSRPVPTDHTALAVAMPRTAGLADLPEAVTEVAALASRITGTTPLVGPAATTDEVLASLPNARIAHFACHAVTDPAEPASSHLLLADGPLTVTDISGQDLINTELAYLSACATARGSVDMADEAIHAASAFQLAGYAQVVATMWDVEDKTAAAVTGRFYTELTMHEGRLDAARALHTVLRELRDQHRDEPARWAGYLHAGA